MTEEQQKAVRQLVVTKLLVDEIMIGLHGDCVGADADFNDIMLELPYIATLVRPSTIENTRAYCKAQQIAKAKPPIVRDKDIVADSDVMIACPPNYVKIKRGSGTWKTIGFTRRAKKPLYVVFPNGKIQKENT